MAFPTQTDVEIPLLKVLDSLGGQAKPKDVYDSVARSFPQLTPDDLLQRSEATGGPRWWNHVQWARQKLVERRDRWFDARCMADYRGWPNSHKKLRESSRG
jgi:Mrr N-terminal domain